MPRTKKLPKAPASTLAHVLNKLPRTDTEMARSALRIWPELQAQFPPQSDDTKAALRLDIETNGMHDRLKVLPDGRVFDGMTRFDVTADLEPYATTLPVSVFDIPDDQATDLAWALNYDRRPITAEIRASAINATIFAHPDWSDRRIAERCGVSPTTVGTYRKALEAAGQVQSPETRTGKGGRTDTSTTRTANRAIAKRTARKRAESVSKGGKAKAPKKALAVGISDGLGLLLKHAPGVGLMDLLNDSKKSLSADSLPAGMGADHWNRLVHWHQFLAAVVALRPAD